MSDEERAQKRAADAEDVKKHWTRRERRAGQRRQRRRYLTTDKEYGDIELLLEYKTVAKADSGIYLRGTPQVQIWDTTEGGRQVEAAAPTRARAACATTRPGAPGKDPLVLADKPFGEWNSFRILQVGERTTV